MAEGLGRSIRNLGKLLGALRPAPTRFVPVHRVEKAGL
jgi:hypothetical protein